MSASKKVLVVDDEEDIREVTQVSLEMLKGWTVVTAGSGGGGLIMASKEQPDVILLDVMMPDMDGPTTFSKLQADPTTTHIPVILLTAKVQAADRQRFASLGIKAVISKPFDPMKLAEQIETVVGWTT
jgi:CheY-like chemotaxis protein